ncbi:hypothetical protein [Tenacibaculum sp. 190524A05c]|uniref:Uncharacterized protein n=1 Tax=Tenacibaculum platacis TaxID=3137852 RepID=A0ABP1EFX9_9FLAO
MHKKLASDLTSLAHSILQMKNKEDVLALKEKAYEVYEKLALLAYVEEYINTTPQAKETKAELIEKIEQSSVIAKETEVLVATQESTEEPEEVHHAEEVKEEVVELVEESIEETVIETQLESPVQEEEIDTPENLTEEVLDKEVVQDEIVQEENKVDEPVEEVAETKQVVVEIVEQPFDELENLLFGEEEIFVESPDAKKIEDHDAQPTLEDELQDTLPVDVMADLFQKVEPQKTVNDLLQNTIKIDLNDRIAFVNHLFAGDQANFNRVVSQLNTFKTEKEAKSFISKMVKPDYDWSDKEEYETRLLEIIERRFA